MKSRLALLGGGIALGAVLFYALHGDDSNAQTTSSSTERTADRSRAQARSAGPNETGQLAAPGVVKHADTVEHANVDGLPEELEPGYLAIEHAAKGCYRGRPAPTPIRPAGPDETIESIRLSYRQVANHGVGRVENLKVNDGELTDKALQACIVKAAAGATWSSTEPDGVIGDLEQNIMLGDLLRPDHGLPPVDKRSPTPTAPPPPELAGPLGQQAPEPEDDHADVIVADPSVAKQRK
ncbi:MAG TPA: hypothetical protein VMZ53_05565 [Kofleriaceae bacterium]|nr:hypothetical protein [Kofleriaceae bacterium]